MGDLRGRLESWASSHKGGLVDLTIALGLLALAELLQFQGTDMRLEAELAPVQVLPVALRRNAPLATLAVMVVATFGAYLYWRGAVLPGLGAILAIELGIYTVAEYRPRLVSLPVLAAFNFAVLVLDENNPWGVGVADMLPGTIALVVLPSVAAWIAGDMMRLHRIKTAEFARLAAVEEAVADERARIARELHDVVAHSLSVMVVQAGAARRVLDRDPAEATNSMFAIEATGREALVEMRRLLGIVRSPGGDAPARAPQPGLQELEALLGSVRQAGIAVSLEVDGAAKPLPPGVSLAAYRLVQEALTNVMKHAHAGRARVILQFERDALRVRVTDDGHGLIGAENGRGDGYGLAGLRERIALYGGSFESGDLPDHSGFYVAAKLPLSST